MHKRKRLPKPNVHLFQVVSIIDTTNEVGTYEYAIHLKMIGTSPASSLFIRLYEIVVPYNCVDEETVAKFKNHSIDKIILKGLIQDNLIYLFDSIGRIGTYKITYQNA